MITVRLEKPGELRLVNDDNEPGMLPGDALVEVKRIGVCGTDWHAFHGTNPFFEYPRILGHELGVEVLEVRPGKDGETPPGVAPGSLCAVEPYLNDEESPASRRGRSNCCEHLRVLGVHIDGGMRERIVIPASKLHPSATLDLDRLALVETLCIGAHAIERRSPGADDAVLVIGAGPIGLSVIQFAVLSDAPVAVMDVSASRLEFCRQQFELAAFLDGSAGEPLEEIRDTFGGRLPTIVFDATGNQESMNRSFSYLANGGTLVFVGIIPGEVTFSDPEFHRRELTVMSSRNAVPGTFRNVIAALESETVDSSWWITHRFPLREVPETLPRLASEKNLLKAMVEAG